jgi:hypothetical protein
MQETAAKTMCEGCNHPLSQHFRDVTGVARCLHSKERTSTGVIMTFTVHCDCAEFKSEQRTRQLAKERREAEEERNALDEVLKPILEKCDALPKRT